MDSTVKDSLFMRSESQGDEVGKYVSRDRAASSIGTNFFLYELCLVLPMVHSATPHLR
jgi:hypothetical protein